MQIRGLRDWLPSLFRPGYAPTTSRVEATKDERSGREEQPAAAVAACESNAGTRCGFTNTQARGEGADFFRSAGAPAVPVTTGMPVSRDEFTGPVQVGRGAVPEIYLRQQRRYQSFAFGFVVFVVIPTVLAVIYYYGIASNRYVSHSQLIVYSESSSGGGEGLLSLIQLGGGPTQLDQAKMLTNFIQSPEILAKLEERLGVRNLYSREDIDFLSRLDATASDEDLFDYYKQRIGVSQEPRSSIISVSAEAFSAESAYLMLSTIMTLSEEALNSALQKKRNDVLGFAEDEIAKAEQRLAVARQDIAQFRFANAEFDPQSAVSGVGGIIIRLKGELATERTKLESMLSYLNPNSAQIDAQQAKIKAIRNQLKTESRDLVSSGDNNYVDRVRRYENLQLHQAFAQQAYNGALAFLEKARTDLAQKHSYVIDFVKPTLPMEATMPRRLHSVVEVFVVMLLVYVAITLITAAIREQARL